MASRKLGLEGLAVLIAGAQGETRTQVCREFQGHGCRVAIRNMLPDELSVTENAAPADVAHRHERYVYSSIDSVMFELGSGINILIVMVDVDRNGNSNKALWDTEIDDWEQSYRANICRPFLIIKQFLQGVRRGQELESLANVENVAIVVVGRKIDGPLYEIFSKAKRDIRTLNSRVRINAIALQGSSTQCEPVGQVRMEDIASLTGFLASHDAAGTISGECIEMNSSSVALDRARYPLQTARKRRVKVALTIDFDAVSGWLGTGAHADNVLADYSTGFFAARVGAPRLMQMLNKLGIADKCTWFIPGHSAESFREQVSQIVESGCEIGLHGYAHEGAYQLTPEQERDVLERCIDISTELTGKKPAGYRAPLYQVRESTLDLLEEYGFEYDASLADHDCRPFFAPRRPPIHRIDFSKPASSWMHPIVENDGARKDRRPLVEIPCNWYMEDMTPMQYLPHVQNSHGYVDVRIVQQMWKDRFLWVWQNEEDAIFPLIIHPDTSGMAHVIVMVEQMIEWLQAWGQDVEFCQAQEVARAFRAQYLDSRESDGT